MGGVCFCELEGYGLCAVGGAIVDDYEFPIELSSSLILAMFEGIGEGQYTVL